MEALRTPESRFDHLEDFPYQPHYVEIDGMRMHYLDEGKGETILCLHGEPTWSYLYRKFIPVLSPEFRVVAPDFFGFGKSDKPTNSNEYSYQFHLNSLIAFVEKVGLKNLTIVVQDWGGLLGLGLVGARPDWFDRVVILNTGLPVGKSLPLPFKIWQFFAKVHPSMPVAGVIKFASHNKKAISPAVKKAYVAPYPSGKYKAGVKAFPGMVPGKPNDPGVTELKRAREVLSNWDKPALVLFSDKDPVFSKGVGFFKNLIPTAKDQPDLTIRDAGHFLQEEKGEEIAEYIRLFMRDELNLTN